MNRSIYISTYSEPLHYYCLITNNRPELTISTGPPVSTYTNLNVLSIATDAKMITMMITLMATMIMAILTTNLIST